MKQCTIHIRDEVNVKIEGLDIDCRKKLVNTFKYEIPGARYQPAVRLGRWDGKVAYFQVSGSSYINLLPEIIPILEQYDYNIELCLNLILWMKTNTIMCFGPRVIL